MDAKDDRYKDLEDLLFMGFIPHKARIFGVDFVFKTVSDLEYRKISLMSGVGSNNQYHYRFHQNYLYHSLFMVNGINILENRDEIYSDIIDIFKSFPTILIRKIFDILDTLAARLNKSVNLVEPYSYESISRYSWLSKRNIVLNSHQSTGIKGTGDLGLNQFQKYWSVLNIREDDKESFDDRYSLCKFLASFTDPKSVKKIDAQDKAKKEEEIDKRDRIKLFGTKEEEYLGYADPTATKEGIISELERQMRGDKDDHDKAIENHERKLRANMLQQMQELKKMQEYRKKSMPTLEEARPISKEEMLERMNKSKAANRVYMKATDVQDSKYSEMSNVRSEDILKESGITDSEYENLANDETYGKISKTIIKRTFEDDSDNSNVNYEREQKRLAAIMGLDDAESDNMDFPNLRNR